MKRSRIANTVYTVAALLVLGGAVFSEAAGPREFIGELWNRRPRLRKVKAGNWSPRKLIPGSKNESGSKFDSSSVRGDLYQDPFAGSALPETGQGVVEIPAPDSPSSEPEPAPSQSRPVNQVPVKSVPARNPRRQLLPTRNASPSESPTAPVLPSERSETGSTLRPRSGNRFSREFDREFQRLVDQVVAETRREAESRPRVSERKDSDSPAGNVDRSTNQETSVMRATRNPQRRGILLPLSPQSRGKAELIVPEERAGSLPDVSPGIGRSPVRAPRPGGIHVPLPSNSLLETHSPENRSRHHESLPAGTVEPPGPVTQHAPRQELADMIPSLPPADRKAASARAHQDFSRFVPGSRRPAESSVTSVSAEDASTAEDVQTTRPLIVELPPRRRRLEELLSDPHQDSGRTQRILPSSVESRRHGESSSFAQGSELYELRHPESQRSRLPSSSRRIIDFTDHRFRSRWSDHSDRRSSGVETVPRRTPVRPRATSNGARTLSVPNTNRFRQLSYEQPDMSESPVRAPGRFPKLAGLAGRAEGPDVGTEPAPADSASPAPTIRWPGQQEMVTPKAQSSVPWGFSGSVLAIVIALVALLMHRSCKVVTVVTTDSREVREHVSEATSETPVN